MSEEQGEAGAARKPIAFISHHNSQEKTARHLKAVFERNGVIGWMAPDDIEPGLPFDRAIIAQVKKSDIIVLLFCAQSDQSKHVKREIMLAEDQDKLIYPVRLEAIEPTGLAYWLQDYQWIDWVDRRDITIERMLTTVKRQVAAVHAAANPRPPAPVVETPPADAKASDTSDATVARQVADARAAPPPAPPHPPNPASAAPAGPAMVAPMPLVGGASSAGSGGGDDHGAVKSGGVAGKIDRNGWIAIGVVGLLLLILIGIAITNAGGSSAEDGGDDARGQDEGGGGGSDEGAFVIEPGMWESRTEDVAIVFPQLDPTVADTMIDGIQSGSVDSDCVSEAEARDPGVSLFDPDGAGNCELHDLMMENGEITAELTCRPADMQGGEMTYALRGGYTDTSVEGNVQVAIMPGTPNELRYRGRLTSRRTGQCD